LFFVICPPALFPCLYLRCVVAQSLCAVHLASLNSTHQFCLSTMSFSPSSSSSQAFSPVLTRPSSASVSVAHQNSSSSSIGGQVRFKKLQKIGEGSSGDVLKA